jgi:hypothetical protein
MGDSKGTVSYVGGRKASLVRLAKSDRESLFNPSKHSLASISVLGGQLRGNDDRADENASYLSSTNESDIGREYFSTVLRALALSTE